MSQFTARLRKTSTIALVFAFALTALLLGSSVSTPGADAGTPSSITVFKITNPPGDLTPFTVNLTGPVNDSTVLTDGSSHTFSNLPAGTYTLTEVMQPGWTQTDFGCADAGNNQTFDLAIGEDRECFFENTMDATPTPSPSPTPAPTTGQVTVFKITHPSGDPQQFTININGPMNDTAQLTDGDSITFGDLPPGTYTLSEILPPGWIQTGFSCADAGNNPTFTIIAGDDRQCAFDNTFVGTPTPTPTEPPETDTPTPSGTVIGETQTPFPTGTGAVGGLVDVVSGNGEGGLGTGVTVLLGLLFAVGLTGVGVVSFRRAGLR